MTSGGEAACNWYDYEDEDELMVLVMEKKTNMNWISIYHLDEHNYDRWFGGTLDFNQSHKMIWMKM